MADTSDQTGQEFERALAESATEVASFDESKRIGLERIQHVLHSNPALVPLIVLVLSVIVFGLVIGGKFFSPFAMSLILQQVAIVGFVGAAQTLVILTAGIDLSVGAIMVLSSVVMGQFSFRYGLPAELAVLCGFAVGGICGYINGALVAIVRLPPFIVTLGCGRSFWLPTSCTRPTRRSAARTSRHQRLCCSCSARSSRSAVRC